MLHVAMLVSSGARSGSATTGRPAIPIHNLSGRTAFDPCPILLDRSLALGPGLLLALQLSLPLMVLGLEAS